MKINKLTLIISSFLLAVGTSWGQHAITQAAYPDAVEHTIVREHVFPATVSYVQTSTDHYFAYADAGMTVSNAAISHDIYVTDLAVHGDYAYFCGYNSISATGVWGWLYVPSLASGASNYHIYDNFVCGTMLSDSLYSLAVYEEAGMTHVAAVGSAADGNGQRLPCLIVISGHEGTPSGWQYQMGVSECVNAFSRMTQVCVTDKLIVAAGQADRAMCGEGYRVHYRSAPFSTTGPQDTLHHFPDHHHNGIDMAMTHTTGDMVASAVYHYSDDVYGIVDYIWIKVIDFAQIITSASSTPVYSFYYNNSLIYYTIRDLVYSRTARELVLLMSQPSPGPWGNSVLAELPLPPTPANVSYISDCLLLSLDNYNSGNNILAQGIDLNVLQNVNSVTQPLLTTPNCTTPLPARPTDKYVEGKWHYCPYTVFSNDFECQTMDFAETFLEPNIIICDKQKNHK